MVPPSLAAVYDRGGLNIQFRGDSLLLKLPRSVFQYCTHFVHLPMVLHLGIFRSVSQLVALLPSHVYHWHTRVWHTRVNHVPPRCASSSVSYWVPCTQAHTHTLTHTHTHVIVTINTVIGRDQVYHITITMNSISYCSPV